MVKKKTMSKRVRVVAAGHGHARVTVGGINPFHAVFTTTREAQQAAQIIRAKRKKRR